MPAKTQTDKPEKAIKPQPSGRALRDRILGRELAQQTSGLALTQRVTPPEVSRPR